MCLCGQWEEENETGKETKTAECDREVVKHVSALTTHDIVYCSAADQM